MAAPLLEAVVVFFTADVAFLPAITFLTGGALALAVVGLAADLGLAAALAVDFLAAAVLLVPADLAEADAAVVRGLGAAFLAVLALVVAVLATFAFGAVLGLGAGLFCHRRD